jgi:hypothetical protein
MRRLFLSILAACSSSTHHPSPDGGVSGIDDLVASCEAFDACRIDIPGQVNNNQTEGANACLYEFAHGHAPLRPAFVQCMAAAHGDCAMARACVGQTVQSGMTCTTGGGCQGAQVSSCQFGTLVTIDCTVTDPRTQCMSGQCVFGPATPSHCDGDYLVQNQSNILDVEYDCSQYGETCLTSGNGPLCAGAGPACTAARADGTTIVWCDTGFEHAVDCAALGGATVQQGTKSDYGTVDYCGFGTACQPTLSAATCSGNSLTLCALGQTYQLDCVAAGYSGCATSRCTPQSLP